MNEFYSLRGIIGIALILIIAWLVGGRKKNIQLKPVLFCLVIQFLLAFAILKVPFVSSFFYFIGKIIVHMLAFSKEGSRFLFGALAEHETLGYIFVFQVLPTIIFFAALTSILFYFGIIQFVVRIISTPLRKLAGLSSAESIAATANIFLGQIEAPLLIKAYLSKLSLSELFVVMSTGLATIAGGVMAAYVAFLGGGDHQQQLMFAKHLLAASVMAAPGAIALSKLMIPAEKNDASYEITNPPKQQFGKNILDALINGTMQGLKIAVTVAALLLVFLASIALINFIFLKSGQVLGLNDLIAQSTQGKYTGLSLQYILGLILSPLLWIIGIDGHNLISAGALVGEKIIMNEFIAYIHLAEMKAITGFLSERTIIMLTYMLCGFANFGSVGMLIGGLSTMCPEIKTTLTSLGFKALICGALASLLSASMIGVLL
jgi:concentrative nucleoside transporter, CNT family